MNEESEASALGSEYPEPQGGPLEGVRVLEVSSVVMAPFAGRLLAKMGADVVRVEAPVGDIMRRTGASRHDGMTGVVMSLWDGKRSIAIDTKTAGGRSELRGLIRNTDIIITNYLPWRRSLFGLDWESVQSVNPRIVLCTAQGYSSHSDKANTPAYDDTIQAASGVCGVYQKAIGEPRYAPYILADKVCGLTMVYSSLAALHHRDMTGRGQWVDVPMADVMVDFNLTEQLNDYTFEPPLGPAGWHRTLAPSRQPHPCQDGWVCVLPYSDINWRRFLELVDDGNGFTQPSYETNRARNENMEGVQQIIADYVKGRTTAEIVRECEEREIPVQPVNRVEDLVHDSYLRRRGTVSLVEHPTEGAYWRTTPNINFSDSPVRSVRLPSSLDEDRESILSSLAEPVYEPPESFS